MKTIKVGSDFSGVGAFNQALIRLEINYKELFACDMDKYARQTFIHNYGEPEYYPMNVYDREIPSESLDIYMTSPPCQAFSLAGKRLGKDDKRGILFFNSHEFIKVNKPRFFIFENVKGLLSDDNGNTFSEWINMLGGKSVNGVPVLFPYDDAVEYHLYWKVLNAKNHGVPQNRERVFLVGIRDDQDNQFRWPIEEHLTKRLKDVLEDDVDEKYFLSDKMVNYISKDRKGNDNLVTNREVANTITCEIKKMQRSMQDNYIDINKLGYINQDTQASALYSDEGLAPTMCAGSHGYAMGYIHINSATFKGYEEATVIYKYQKEIEQSLNQDICTGIDASYYKGFGVRQGKCRQVVNNNYGIRRLTPRECFRLMDFHDTFTWPVSDSQAYKQAGNSIVVRVLEKIIKNLPL